MKIALVIPGRFHGFDLARALMARGHAVTVLTTYPRQVTRRFGLPDEAVRSAAHHEAVRRLINRMPGVGRTAATEAALNRAFGRWAERALAAEPWDVIHGWSGVSEEHLTSPRVRRDLTILMRGSSHIAEQARLLDQEHARAGVPIDRPSPWMVARELREYAAADAIGVLSGFARESFIAHGVEAERLDLVPPGVDATAFAANAATSEARLARVRSGTPLRLLFVGTVSYRKGIADLADAVERLDPSRFQVRLVGPVLPEARNVLARVADRVTVTGKIPQDELRQAYAAADVFVFPTIEDGFAVVLAQARAAGLPLVTTPNCAGPDLIRPGEDGWIVPVRDPAALAARLQALDADRPALERAVRQSQAASRPTDWSAAATIFESACERRLSEMKGARA